MQDIRVPGIPTGPQELWYTNYLNLHKLSVLSCFKYTAPSLKRLFPTHSSDHLGQCTNNYVLFLFSRCTIVMGKILTLAYLLVDNDSSGLNLIETSAKQWGISINVSSSRFSLAWFQHLFLNWKIRERQLKYDNALSHTSCGFAWKVLENGHEEFFDSAKECDFWCKFTHLYYMWRTPMWGS